jgi:hypothetical protein
MTATEAAIRQAKHENLTSQLIHALQRADAVLYVQEKLKGMDHTGVRAEIDQALNRAYKESLQ